MTQVSRPMLMALVGTLAFAAVWFVLLRPKPVTTGQSAPPAADAASQQASNAAAADAAGTDAPPQAGTGSSTPPAPSPSAAAPPDAAGSPSAAAGADPSAVTVEPGTPPGERAILRQLASGTTVVVLFWSANNAVDREARRAVREATRGRSKVAVRLVPIKDVGAYESITGGVTVAQSPTTMIIGPGRKAVTITGLVDPLEIEQAIGRMAPTKG